MSTRGHHAAGREDLDELYELGISDEEPEDEAPALSKPRLLTAAAAAEPFALKGCVLTPTERLDDAYVVIAGSTIQAVQQAKPDAKVVDTDGVILPGFIDLHGHPEYNVFAAWEPPKLYKNRYLWRQSDEYQQVVREPWTKLTANPGSLLRNLTRYSEVRALVSGVTAIQGASAKYPGKDEALVRNVDLRIFGEHKARSIIDLGRTDDADRKHYRDQIDSGMVTALYIHLAEGVDARSEREFGELVDAKLLTPATVIIHGTALTEAELGQVKDAGAKLVWSPQSNLRLYGRTTEAAKALALDVPLGLGADWLPSGSQNLLGELKVARRVLVEQDTSLANDKLARRLVLAVTVHAAAIAGLEGRLGEIAEGRLADVLVLERRFDDPWQNVVEADPSWVDLVTIGGDLAYGRSDWMTQLSVSGAQLEPWIAWGKQMALDTSYAASPLADAPLRLSDLRASLLGRFPQTGPIFA